MNLKKACLVIVTILTIFLFTAALVSAEPTASKCPKTVKVETEKIVGQQFQEYKVFRAKVFPEIIAVKSVVSGKISDVKVAAGDLVSRNLELVVIDDALAKEIKALEEEVQKWQRTLRARRNWKVRSEKAEKQAENMFKEAEVKLEVKKTTAVNYVITSPTDGKIKSLKVVKDGEIAAGQVVIEIENTQKMYAAVQISAEDLMLFFKGQGIPVKFTEIDEKYNAVVTEVTGGEIVLLVENKIKEIKVDYTFEFVMLKAEHKDAVVVAKNRLLEDETGKYVYKVEGKYAKRADLQIKAITDNRYLLAAGLAIGDEIIVSEILSAKGGTVKDQLECVGDKVKIKVLALDPETGKFKKVKAGEKRVVKKEVVKREKPVAVKKPKVKKEKTALPTDNYFIFGAGPGIIYVNQTWWADVYSKGAIAYGMKLSYRLKNKFEIFGEVDYMQAKGEVIPTGEESKFTNIPVYLGGKYLFMTGSKLTPFAGVAAVLDMVTEVNVIGTESQNGLGLSIMAGLYLDITTKLTLDLCMKYDIMKYTLEKRENKADMSGARLFLMFSYKFK